MGKIVVEYLPDKIKVEEDENLSILQISLKNQIPHTHVCFGEAQCSTCRVEILEGIENVSPRNSLEIALAKKKGWDERIRLACQTILLGNVKLRRLVLDEYDAQIAQEEFSEYLQGVYNEVVVLFLDIQNFTKFVEEELPYDVFFYLNRYFNLIGDLVLINGGLIDKFIGDSLMAIFGIDNRKPTLEFCLDGVYSGIKMLEITKKFNEYLKANLNREFSVRIGIAYGKAILGMLGHRKKNQYTGIGNVVNLANRLESANKKTNTNILISDSLYNILKNKLIVGKKFLLKLKGFKEVQTSYELIDVIDEEKEKREKRYNEFYTKTPHSSTRTGEIIPPEKNLEFSIPEDLTLLEIDKMHSQITFKIKHLGVDILGYVKDFDAEIYLDVKNFLNSKVKLVIPIKQITTFSDARDKHLFSPDFFDIEKYPSIIFVSTEISSKDKNEWILYGNLFMRGKTKAISINLIQTSESLDPFNLLKLCFTGTTILNREDFDITYNVRLQNNEFLLGKEVQIFFSFECIKKL